MTDAERLREIADLIERDHPFSRDDLRAIADRLEKREAFTKAAMFGAEIELDEAGLLREMARVISEAKDKYHPEKNVIRVRMVPDSSSVVIAVRTTWSDSM